MTGQAGTVWVELLIAAVIVVGLSLLASLVLSSDDGRGGLLHGLDRRASTSKTVQFMWTAVVAWMVASEALVAAFGHPMLTPHGAGAHPAAFGDWMKHVFDAPRSRELYLVLLGGPYAAGVFAKVSVSQGVASGRIQKTTGNPNKVRDVVTNDTGAVDPFDFQYVLFNLLVALAVVGAFAAHVGNGLPTIADFLALLTGGSALTYSVNKGMSSNAPGLTALHPQAARVGDRVTAYGNNLLVAPASQTGPQVTVAGVAATIPPDATPSSDQVTFLVPAPAAGTTWSPGQRETVVVTTEAGLTAQLESALAIALDEPILHRLEPATLTVAAAEDYQRLPLSLYGQFLATPGAANGTAGAARVEITGAAGVPATVDATLDGDHLTFTLPASIAPPEPGAPISLTVAVVRGSVRSSRTLPLTLTASDPAAVNGHGRVVPSSPA